MYRYDGDFSYARPGSRYQGSWYGPPPQRRRWTDRDTLISVRQTLFEDTWLDARYIDIEVSEGVVTLTGRVRDQMSARYAWDDAWESAGVRGVVSRLEVAGSSGSKASEKAPPETAS